VVRAVLSAAALVLVPLTAALVFLARAGFQITGCVEAPGALGWLGTRLALVHADPSCAAGTLLPGGTPGQVLTVLACVTVPVLLAHAGLGLAALPLVRWVVRRVREAGAVIVQRRYRVLTVPTVPVPRRRVIPRPPVLPAVISDPALAVPGLRAPPVAAAA
jgi:hypothetical protein